MTNFGLDSKTGIDPGPTSPYNKFIDCERKN